MGGTSSIAPSSPQNFLTPLLPATLNPVHTPLPNLKPHRHSNSHDFRSSAIKIPINRKRIASTDHVTRIDIREAPPILPSKPFYNPVYTADSTCGTISPSFRCLKPISSTPECSLSYYSRAPSHTSSKISPSKSPSPSTSTYKLIHSAKCSTKRPKVRFACLEGEARNMSDNKRVSNIRVKASCKVMRYKSE